MERKDENHFDPDQDCMVGGLPAPQNQDHEDKVLFSWPYEVTCFYEVKSVFENLPHSFGLEF